MTSYTTQRDHIARRVTGEVPVDIIDYRQSRVTRRWRWPLGVLQNRGRPEARPGSLTTGCGVIQQKSPCQAEAWQGLGVTQCPGGTSQRPPIRPVASEAFNITEDREQSVLTKRTTQKARNHYENGPTPRTGSADGTPTAAPMLQRRMPDRHASDRGVGSGVVAGTVEILHRWQGGDTPLTPSAPSAGLFGSCAGRGIQLPRSARGRTTPAARQVFGA
jgi:hypothetical protein